MQTTSSRAVRDDIQNALDYLVDADLCLAANPVGILAKSPLKDGVQVERVRFVPYGREEAFLISHGQPGIAQYLAWLRAGFYSAVLFDGSLIQLTYDVSANGKVVGHRLAYMPCPYDIDPDLFEHGSLLDIIELYDGSTDIALRSQLRFDFDPATSTLGHPAAHLTFNSPHCRIACIAPTHVMRFLAFVFQNYYPTQWRFHEVFFETSLWRHLGDPVLATDDRFSPHLSWDINATMSNVKESRGLSWHVDQ